MIGRIIAWFSKRHDKRLVDTGSAMVRLSSISPPFAYELIVERRVRLQNMVAEELFIRAGYHAAHRPELMKRLVTELRNRDLLRDDTDYRKAERSLWKKLELVTQQVSEFDFDTEAVGVELARSGYETEWLIHGPRFHPMQLLWTERTLRNFHRFRHAADSYFQIGWDQPSSGAEKVREAILANQEERRLRDKESRARYSA